MNESGIRFFLYVNLLTLLLACHPAAGQIIDDVYLGDSTSEKQHNAATDNTEIRIGELGQSCRVILPRTPATVSGGSITFTLQCDTATISSA
jgi:hypothetical protein